MAYGFKVVWVDEALPCGGDVSILDDHGELTCLASRPAFAEDPEAFMAALERHCDGNIKGRKFTLSLAV